MKACHLLLAVASGPAADAHNRSTAAATSHSQSPCPKAALVDAATRAAPPSGPKRAASRPSRSARAMTWSAIAACAKRHEACVRRAPAAAPQAAASAAAGPRRSERRRRKSPSSARAAAKRSSPRSNPGAATAERRLVRACPRTPRASSRLQACGRRALQQQALLWPTAISRCALRLDHGMQFHRADLHALRLVEMADALGAFVRLDLVDLRAHRDRLVRGTRARRRRS